MPQLDLSVAERTELSSLGISTYQQLKQALVDGRLHGSGWGVERLISIAAQCYRLEENDATG